MVQGPLSLDSGPVRGTAKLPSSPVVVAGDGERSARRPVIPSVAWRPVPGRPMALRRRLTAGLPLSGIAEGSVDGRPLAAGVPNALRWPPFVRSLDNQT